MWFGVQHKMKSDGRPLVLVSPLTPLTYAGSQSGHRYVGTSRKAGTSHLTVTFHTVEAEDRKTAGRRGMLQGHWGLSRK